MAKRKPAKLTSTAGTGHFYTIMPTNSKEKVNVKKYDPKARKHVLYEQKGKLS